MGGNPYLKVGETCFDWYEREVIKKGQAPRPALLFYDGISVVPNTRYGVLIR
jgi:hypothetical protein